MSAIINENEVITSPPEVSLIKSLDPKNATSPDTISVVVLNTIKRCLFKICFSFVFVCPSVQD